MYTSRRFVQPPQFKGFLANLSKDQLVDCPHSAWRLSSASVQKVKTTTTFAVPNPALRETIVAACGDSVGESFENDCDDAQNQFDLVPVLRAKREKTLRELVGKEWVALHTYEIIT
jgi:hypothetical protein